jgi:pimeloyl-ACP methyl ester carboxylesterase
MVSRPRRLGHVRVRWAELPNGLALPYVERGGDPGIPLVLLHGFAESWRSFERLLPALPRSTKAFAPSLRGHGGRRTEARDYSLDATASDVASLMDALGVATAVVVGSSSGGYVAQQLALDRPERVSGLVLVGSPRSLHGLPEIAAFAHTLAAQGDPLELAFVREFTASTLRQPVPPAFLDAMVRDARAIPTPVWQAVLEALIGAAPPTETGSIAAPALILWGARDAFVSRLETDRLATAIPSSRLTVYERAGHAVLWEEPERVAVDIGRFLHSLAA